MLDDNGDGKGTAAPGQPGADGALARTLFMSAAAAGRAVPDQADPSCVRSWRSATRSRRALPR